MKSNINIGLDVDGILANFYLAACRHFKKPHIDVDKWHLDWLSSDKWDELATRYMFWEQIPTLIPPESINVPIECYISSLPLSMIRTREIWLKNNNYPIAPLIQSNRKYEDYKRWNLDLFVDDSPYNVHKMFEKGCNVIWFIPYYFSKKMISECMIKYPACRRSVKNLSTIENYLR